MKKLITLMILIILLVSASSCFAFYLWWPSTGSSSYKVYEVIKWNPPTLTFIEEVFENRFNLDGYIDITDWTFFAVSNCCGADCSAIHNIVGILDTDQSNNPAIKASHYQREIELKTPINIP